MQTLFEDGQRIPECYFAVCCSADTLNFVLFTFFEVGEPQFRDQNLIGVQTSANELALHPDSGKINL